MNSTRAKKRLVDAAESSRRLEYGDDSAVEEGDTIQIYGRRHNRGHEVEWSCREVYREDNEVSIPEEKDIQQLILKGTITTRNNSYKKYEISDVSVVEKSAISKPKEKIKQQFISLWRVGWPENYLYGNKVVNIDTVNWTDKQLRPVTEEDVKVTTARKNGKAMHLGRSGAEQDCLFKLGVNWESWHRMDATSRFKTLTHEMVHCLHANHKRRFFREHASVVGNIAASEGRRKRSSNLFEGEINWDRVKALTLYGVHNQPKELYLNDHKTRLDACEALVKELEDIVDYTYEWGRVLYISPPTDSLRAAWVYNFEPDDDEEWPSREELRPDSVERININTLSIPDNFSDEELYDTLMSIKEEGDWITYVYSESDIPVVNDNGEIVENEAFAALYNRMYKNAKANKPIEPEEEIIIPIQRE